MNLREHSMIRMIRFSAILLAPEVLTPTRGAFPLVLPLGRGSLGCWPFRFCFYVSATLNQIPISCCHFCVAHFRRFGFYPLRFASKSARMFTFPTLRYLEWLSSLTRGRMLPVVVRWAFPLVVSISDSLSELVVYWGQLYTYFRVLQAFLVTRLWNLFPICCCFQ